MKPRWIFLAAALVFGVFLASWWGHRTPETSSSAAAPPERPKPLHEGHRDAPAAAPATPPAPTAPIPPAPTATSADIPRTPSPWAAALERLRQAAKAYEERRKNGEAAALPEREAFLRALQKALDLPLGDSGEAAGAFQAILDLESRLLDRAGLSTLADDLWGRESEAARLNAILLWTSLQDDRADPLLAARLKGEALAYLSKILDQDGGDAIAKRLSVSALNGFLHLFPDDAEAVVAVSRGLAHADPESRGVAVITLGNVKSEAALAELKRLVREDPDGQVQSFAVWSLGNFPADQVQDILPELRKRMERGDPNAILTMAKFGEKAAAPWLIQQIPIYAHDDYEGSLGATALAPLLDETSKASLAPLLKNPDPRVRANAAAALALARDPAGQVVLREILEKKLTTPGGPLEQIAALGLARLGDERARPYLEAMAKSGDARTRTSALEALQLLPAKP